MRPDTEAILDDLAVRYPQLSSCEAQIRDAYIMLEKMYREGGKLLACGNGGSAADCEHVVGELMKTFKIHRPVPGRFRATAREMLGADRARALSDALEGALPAISLVSQTALSTAFGNDRNATYVFAQQVLGYGKPGDVLLAISTSGSSRNIIAAAEVAKVLGMGVIALTGSEDAPLDEFSDVIIQVPEKVTFKVQELHLPIYHALCAALENEFFGEREG